MVTIISRGICVSEIETPTSEGARVRDKGSGDMVWAIRLVPI